MFIDTKSGLCVTKQRDLPKPSHYIGQERLEGTVKLSHNLRLGLMLVRPAVKRCWLEGRTFEVLPKWVGRISMPGGYKQIREDGISLVVEKDRRRLPDPTLEDWLSWDMTKGRESDFIRLLDDPANTTTTMQLTPFDLGIAPGEVRHDGKMVEAWRSVITFILPSTPRF